VAGTAIEVGAVQTKEDYTAFVDVPWQVPTNRPSVRPMREFERHLFDRSRRFRGGSLTAQIDGMLLGKDNPFYEHGEIEMFLAKDHGGRPIARIAAIHNHLHNDFHGDKVGFFGFYQCVDGGETGRVATRAVVDLAGEWLRARGLESIRGPFNPTINDDCGIWVEGESYPTFLMPSNPHYYDDHLRAAGLAPVKSLRVYRLGFETISEDEWARWAKFAGRLQRSNPGLVVRGANFKDLDSEVKSFVSVFNAAWSRNWGFAPMSYSELRSLAELFQYMVDPNLIRAAEVEENGARKMVGVIIAVPDLNEFLRHSGGRLLHPTMIWKLIRMKTGRPTNRIRIAVLGVLPEYRHTPVSALLLYDALHVSKSFGAKEVEASWVLEDNVPMVKPLEDYHFAVTDRYLLYEKGLA
jgi:hypothetical protein